jgi:hypothetical protein
MMNVVSGASWPSDRTESRPETTTNCNLVIREVYDVLHCGSVVVEAKSLFGKDGGPPAKPQKYLHAHGR